MKALQLLFAILFACSQSASAGSRKVTSTILQQTSEGQWQYEKVIDAPNTAKEVLYKRLKDWIQVNVKTQDNNIVFDDTNFETIITTPTLPIERLPYNHLTSQSINFKLRLSFKEDKMRVQASNFVYYGVTPMAGSVGGALGTFSFDKSIMKDLEPRMDASLKSFFQSLEKAPLATDAGNW